MNDESILPPRVWVATMLILVVSIGVTVWLDRRSGEPSVRLPRLARLTLVGLVLCVPFWLAFYWLAFVANEDWRQSWLGCLLLLAPIGILQIWGFIRLRPLRHCKATDRMSDIAKPDPQPVRGDQ